MRRSPDLRTLAPVLCLGTLLLACAGKSAQEYFRQANTSLARGNSFLALRQFTRAIELDRSFGDAYFARGRVFFSTDRFGRALLDYKTAAELLPSSPDVFFELGNAYQRMGDYRNAIEGYDRCVRLNPTYPNLYFERGNARVALKEYEPALEDFNEAIKGNTTSLAEAHSNRGVIEARFGQHDAAVADFRKSLELNPDDPETKVNLGAAYLALGLRDQAKAMFLAALEDRDGLRDRGKKLIETLDELAQ
jgi:tetratricopeptide (TPR) repeat protein